jgi:hypothetical protein
MPATINIRPPIPATVIPGVIKNSRKRRNKPKRIRKMIRKVNMI